MQEVIAVAFNLSRGSSLGKTGLAIRRVQPKIGHMIGDAPTDESPSQVMAGDTPLIFDWRPVRWRKTRLMVALAVAAAGHLLVFYAFQVVTESSTRQAPPVREAMILSSAEEATRQVIENLEDRLPALSPPAPLEDRGDEALAALVKGYVPTWQDHRPALKPLPGQGGAAPLPALMPNTSAVLPPLAAEPGPALDPVFSGPMVRPQPVLGFQSGLALRPLRRGPAWPAAVTTTDWPEEGPASFLMSVDAAGKVTQCLSLGASTGLDEEEMELLRGVLLNLLFQPAASASGQEVWGQVDVLW